MARAKRTSVKNTKKKSSTDKAQVVRVVVLAFLVLLCLSNFGLLGVVGQGIKWLFFGIFGVMDYVLPFYCGVHIVWRMADRKPSGEIRKKFALGYILMALIDGFVQRVINVPDIKRATPADVFLNSALNKEGGGFIGGLIDKALSPTLLTGSIIILLGLMSLCVIGILDSKKYYEDRNTKGRQITPAQLKKEREEERRFKEEERLHREQLRRERALERESKLKAREEKRENERARAHERELKRIERQKELIREQQEMEELAAGVNRILYEEKYGEKYDYSSLVRSKNKVRGVGDFTINGSYGGATPKGRQSKETFASTGSANMSGGTGGSKAYSGHSSTSSEYPGAGSEHLGAGSEYPGKGTGRLGADIGHSLTSSEYSGAGSEYPNTSSEYPDTSSAYPNTSSEYPDTSSAYPEQISQSEIVEGYSTADSRGITLPDDETDRAEIEEMRRRRREERLRRSQERKGIRGAEDIYSDGSEIAQKNVTRTRAGGRTQGRASGAESEKVTQTSTAGSPVKPHSEISSSAEYEFPPLSLLNRGSSRNNISQNENRRTAALLLQTLETFGVKAEITDISCGPAVTRFEIQPPIGTRVSKIVSLSDEIKLNLAAEDIRIEAPIPGKPAIGIEIPNKKPSSVSLYELLDSDTFKKSKSLISFAVGEDITGNAVVADIAKMPHILIAGQTGSGKSVCINSLIMSVLYKARPDQVKMIMIDPKVVELSAYNGIPHLLFPVVTDPRKASGVLNWTVAEMEARYKRFEETGVKNIAGYNEVMSHSADPEAIPMPQLLVIIDELADLMMVAKGDVETAICRLAQLARAAGIHLVIATQRPSVNVITGLIKANVPSKIAFAVASGVNSRTILDMNGAEKLLGKGDMLFFPTGMPKPQRVQGAFVSDKEVAAVVSFLRERNEAIADNDDDEDEGESVTEQTGGSGTLTDIADAFSSPRDDDRDELFEEAAKFVIEKNRGSIGMLQRQFKIGFNRAGRIMDQLSEAGVVGPDIGTKPRQVLMTEEELEEIL